jgi:hypothetical protein
MSGWKLVQELARIKEVSDNKVFWELQAFMILTYKNAMPPEAYETLSELAGLEDQAPVERFFTEQVGDIDAFHRDLFRQFREEYLKPSYQSLRH